MRPISDVSFGELDTIIFLLHKEITTYCLLFFFCFLLLFLALVKLKVSMMQCTEPAGGVFVGEMSVLDRQRARLRWQGMQGLEEEKVMMVPMPPSEYQSFSGDVHVNSLSPFQHFSSVIKNDLGLDNGWPDFSGGFMPPAPFSGEHGLSPSAESFASISRTSSCQPPVGVNAAAKVVVPTEKAPAPAKKRKGAEKGTMSTKTLQMEDYKDKKVKGEVEDDQPQLTPKQSDQTSINVSKKAAKKEASAHTSKENSKASEVQQKPDYIHVRARRGQATDSHSLAERVRREKISERMKYLQDLVPGCNKITGKAGMLDEIINYVQSLQRQVEFLSMKLASVNPTLDFNIDDFFAKEMFPASTDHFPPMSMLPELSNQAFLHYHTLQPVVSCSGLNVATPAPERRAPASLPDGFLDTCFNASSSTNWDIDLHQLYNTDLHQGREPTFAPQQFQGNIQVNDLKMEM